MEFVPERSVITQRLMEVAVELEETCDHERRVSHMKEQELSQRLSALELDRMQSQLACLRMEEALNEERASRADVERRLGEANSRIADLRHELAESEEKCGRHALSQEKEQVGKAQQVDMLTNELIATRFHLSVALRAATNGVGVAQSVDGHPAWPPAEADDLAAHSVSALLSATRSHDLPAVDAILSPTPLFSLASHPVQSVDDDGNSSPTRGDADATDLFANVLGASLHAACSTKLQAGDTGSGLAVVELLLARGAILEWSDQSGRSALHAACTNGNTALASLLLERGADSNRCDARGCTPLHLAASEVAMEHAAEAALDGGGDNDGARGVAEALLRYGADVNLRDASGFTPLERGEAAGSMASAKALAALRDPTLTLIASAKRANGLYRAARYAEAAECYLQALELAVKASCHATDIATLHFNCARAALKQNRHVLALQQAELAVASRADYANARMLQAECHMELLEFGAAAAAYQALGVLEPSNAAWAECEAKARQLDAAGPYKVLGVDRSADAPEIRRAYHQQCLLWHPDKHSASEEAQRRASTMFRRIAAAWEVLGDESRRVEHDLQNELDELHELHEQSRAFADRYAEQRRTTQGFSSPLHASANMYDDASCYAAKMDGFSPSTFASDENRPPFRHRWSSFNSGHFDPYDVSDTE